MPADLQAPIFTDENAAREALEAVRWPNGPLWRSREETLTHMRLLKLRRPALAAAGSLGS